MYVVHVEETIDGPMFYGPIEHYDDAEWWAKQFDNAVIYRLTKPTANADQVLPTLWLPDNRRAANR